MRKVLYPAVGEQTFKDLVPEAKAPGPTYRTTLRAPIRRSDRDHCRRAIAEEETGRLAGGPRWGTPRCLVDMVSSAVIH